MVDYMKNLALIEKNIGYEFRNKALLKLALTHSSYGHELMIKGGRDENNERLEFLGDAVLELVSSDYLFHNYSDTHEGKLSKLRASLVCEPSLAEAARMIHLDEFILLGRGEKNNHGERRDSIVSDAFEAVIGAIYLDGGIDRAREFILKNVLNDIENKRLFYDAKTELQVLVQERFQCIPEYDTIEEAGPPHNREYTVECRIDGKVYGTGKGNSKKSAQQKAAYQAIIKLGV